MTPKQILDSFSETLIQDERILSAAERALVRTLLQHAEAAAAESPETHEQVKGVIASAVGETVAQRAFSVLGSSIVERILASTPTELPELYGAKKKSPAPPGKAPMRTPGVPAPGSPPPSPGEPQHPGVSFPPPAEPQHPGAPLRTPGVPAPGSPSPSPSEPQHPGTPLRTPGVPAPGSPSPSPSEPQHPGATIRRSLDEQTAVGIAERPASLLARCVVLDEFLAPQELQEVIRFALEHEADFRASEVISPNAEKGVVNYEHRRSRVLMDLGRHEDLILDRIKSVLPDVLRKLGMEEFCITGVEAQMTASNDGDYFRFHSDSGKGAVSSRCLTFVYFFHREPRTFEGGELRIHDARLQGDEYVSDGSYQKIVPRQNQIVFFPSELMHEITAVECRSNEFAGSRFTLNGWLRR